MNLFATAHPYPSRRGVVYGMGGMVCASQHLAAQAGLVMLKEGGNAVDAAVAAAACMTVLEPTSNGIGSDAFALVWMDGQLHGLNASGLSPRGLPLEKVVAQGQGTMPRRGWLPVMVPGAPAAWAELSRRFGRLSFQRLLRPAMEYAEEGFPVGPVTARLWNQAYTEFSALEDPCFRPWQDTFAPKGRAPRAGEVWACPDMAQTLRKLAQTRCDSFYRGELARRIEQFAQATGGYLRGEDLADYECQWVQPISTTYRGYEVWELPPNGDGIIALMALGILEGLPMGVEAREGEETLHRQLEAMKLAFADGLRYVADPAYMAVSPQTLLSPDYAARRRALIGQTARMPACGDPDSGGTVYLCAADGDGGMVSFIQSNYHGFGSGIVVPNTGISLQNRGAGFTLESGHENCYAPGKRAFHTIIPGFLTRGGQPVGPFGVMGAYMQPQGHVQVLSNMLDFGLNPQQALDAPRWQWVGDNRVEVEPGFPPEVLDALRRRGHEITVNDSFLTFGRGQMILLGEGGVLAGATEPRADGAVAAW